MDNITAIAYTECNVVCIVFLMIFFLNIRKKDKINFMFDQRIFSAIVLLNAIILVFDSATWLLDTLVYPNSIPILYAVNLAYYIIQPVICLLWLIYTDYKAFLDIDGLKRRLVYYIIPAAAFIVLSVVSIFTGWFFTVTPESVYERGDYMFVGVILTFAYLAAATIISLIKIFNAPTRMSRKVYLTVLLYPVPVIVGALLQLSIKGLSLIWVAAAISNLIIFVNLQNSQISIDHLTGVYNRRYFEFVLSNMLNSHDRNKVFAIMFDLDGFKQINDKMGHLIGDDALISAADVVNKACLRNNSTVARFGGDEFIVLGTCNSKKEIEDLISIINYDLSLFNDRENRPYKLALSYGVAYMSEDKALTLDDFLKLADKRMYQNKELNKGKETPPVIRIEVV